MSNFYEFVLYVEYNEEVQKKTLELSNPNNLFTIRQWKDLDTNDENLKIREIIFESPHNIYNVIIQHYANHNIHKFLGFMKTPIYV